MYLVLVNGTPHGFFPSSVGLEHGDPISPYLFTIIMEVFIVIPDKAFVNGDISSDAKRNEPRVTHLMFADDQLIFCKANTLSARGVHKVLSEFRSLTGLSFNAS